jgi:DNA excision repair protein ERCC-4
MQVGDFVLTPDICVERKAVPDLISSLDSGRLYTQAVSMCRHYATPVLLIEFDPKKAFALQSVSELGTEIRSNNVMSKLVILLLNFPKLRCGPPPPCATPSHPTLVHGADQQCGNPLVRT